MNRRGFLAGAVSLSAGSVLPFEGGHATAGPRSGVINRKEIVAGAATFPSVPDVLSERERESATDFSAQAVPSPAVLKVVAKAISDIGRRSENYGASREDLIGLYQFVDLLRQHLLETSFNADLKTLAAGADLTTFNHNDIAEAVYVHLERGCCWPTFENLQDALSMPSSDLKLGIEEVRIHGLDRALQFISRLAFIEARKKPIGGYCAAMRLDARYRFNSVDPSTISRESAAQKQVFVKTALSSSLFLIEQSRTSSAQPDLPSVVPVTATLRTILGFTSVYSWVALSA
jgi:hypothetical protein